MLKILYVPAYQSVECEFCEAVSGTSPKGMYRVTEMDIDSSVSDIKNDSLGSASASKVRLRNVSKMSDEMECEFTQMIFNVMNSPNDSKPLGYNFTSNSFASNNSTPRNVDPNKILDPNKIPVSIDEIRLSHIMCAACCDLRIGTRITYGETEINSYEPYFTSNHISQCKKLRKISSHNKRHQIQK